MFASAMMVKLLPTLEKIEFIYKPANFKRHKMQALRVHILLHLKNQLG